MTVRRLLREIDARELQEWRAWFTLHPFGEIRGDMQAGIVASVLANAHRKKGAQPATVNDFVLSFGPREAKVMDWQDMKAEAMRINAMLGGSVRADDSKPQR